MFQADQDPRIHLRSTSVNQMRLSNNSNNIKQKKYICENTNCPLRGYEFHWCSSPACPLTNHCHLNGDQCEIVEPSFLAEKDPARFQPQFAASPQKQQQYQSLQQQQQQQHQNQQPRVNTPSNIPAQVVPNNQFAQQFSRNTTPGINRQSQLFNYDPNNRNPSPIMQSQNYPPKSPYAPQPMYGPGPQDYQNHQPRLPIPQIHSYQDETYSPQYNNDCVPIPIVVLKRVYEDRNMRPADHYSSVENLNQHHVSGYHPDEITENYSNPPTTLRSSSTLNIDCDDQNPCTDSQTQDPGLIRHSPTFDCLINNIIQKYYSDVSKRSAKEPSTNSSSNIIDPQLSQQERDQAVLRLSNKSELMNLNINPADHLSRSSTHSLSNLQQQQSRSTSMPLSKVDKSRNVSFSDLNDAPSQYDQNNPNIYTVPPEQSNTAGINSSTAQRLRDPSQIGFERQPSTDQYRSDSSFIPKYEESEYKKKFDERSNNEDNNDYKRSTYTTQYSSDKRVPDYVNSDNYDLPKFKEFKEYTYKEVTKLVKEYTPSRSKPAPPPRYSIKNSPYVQDLNESTESLGQLGLDRPEIITNIISNNNNINSTRSKSSSMISKSDSKDNLKQLGFENLSERLKQKSQVTFDLTEEPAQINISDADNLNTTLGSQLPQDQTTNTQLFMNTPDQNNDSQLKSHSQVQQSTPQQVQKMLSSHSLLAQSQQTDQPQLDLLQQQQNQQKLQAALDAATSAIMNSSISGANTNIKEDKFDLNSRIEQLINEQKKSNEILQTAIKSLCQAYYSSNGGCPSSN
jgi:hypothetical protein